MTNYHNTLFTGYLRSEAPEAGVESGESTGSDTPPVDGNGANDKNSTQNSDHHINDNEPDVMSVFSFDLEEGDETRDEGEEPQGEESFALSLDESLIPDEGFKSLLTEQAQASGLPADKATAFLNSVATKMRETEAEVMLSSDLELKKEWGSSYEANVKKAKLFARKVSQSSGLSLDDLSVLQSPKGFKLLHALSLSTAERSFVDVGIQQPPLGKKEEAESIMNGMHPKYGDAILNPANPLYKQANEEYDRLIGLK